MFRTLEGSTGRLLQLCLGYYIFYIVTGVAVKYFTGDAPAFPGMNDVEYLTYSTFSSVIVVFAFILARQWYRLDSQQRVRLAGRDIPAELLYIVPSGVCTAVVIPTTTLMYTLPISVMVAMVIMRGAIIVVSWLVDAIQIRQGLLKRRVYWQENVAVAFALLAVGAKVLWIPAIVNPAAELLGLQGLRLQPAASDGHFAFFESRAAMTILGSYVLAYGIRIYIMNYYKNTRGKGQKQNNKAFFAVEQISATLTLLLVAGILLLVPLDANKPIQQLADYQKSVQQPHADWGWAMFWGVAYGIVAFFSVFIFMFKGRTATFAGLVNRLTSLIAGTTATLVFHFSFGGKMPAPDDWLALLFILVAVTFLTQAETRRRAELAATGELPAAPRPA